MFYLLFIRNVYHIYNRILETGWMLAALFWALIGQSTCQCALEWVPFFMNLKRNLLSFPSPNSLSYRNLSSPAFLSVIELVIKQIDPTKSCYHYKSTRTLFVQQIILTYERRIYINNYTHIDQFHLEVTRIC